MLPPAFPVNNHVLGWATMSLNRVYGPDLLYPIVFQAGRILWMCPLLSVSCLRGGCSLHQSPQIYPTPIILLPLYYTSSSYPPLFHWILPCFTFHHCLFPHTLHILFSILRCLRQHTELGMNVGVLTLLILLFFPWCPCARFYCPASFKKILSVD